VDFHNSAVSGDPHCSSISKFSTQSGNAPQSYIYDLANFPARFSPVQNRRLLSQRWDYTKPNLGGHIGQSSALPNNATDFLYVALFQNQSASKATAIENRGQILDFSSHVKSRRLMGEMAD